MSLAVSSHGALLLVELDPVSAPGSFTAIAELNGDISGLGLERGETEVTPHNDDIDSYVTGPLKRKPLTISVNYIFGEPTHDVLRTSILQRVRRGYMFRGPDWSTPGEDEVISSGEVTSWDQTNPVREGARSAEVSIRMSKQMIVDGVEYGNAA